MYPYATLTFVHLTSVFLDMIPILLVARAMAVRDDKGLCPIQQSASKGSRSGAFSEAALAASTHQWQMMVPCIQRCAN